MTTRLALLAGASTAGASPTPPPLARVLHGPGQAGITMSLADRRDKTLQAGRYRFYLLADGPATVRIPAAGSTGRALRPSVPATAAVGSKESTRPGLAGWSVR